MPHSRFRHDRHESMSCEACHTRNGLPYKDIDTKTLYPTLPATANELATVFASTTSRDILMPAIEVCQKCHGQRAVNTGTVAVGAGVHRVSSCSTTGARDKVTKTGIREFLEGRSPAGSSGGSPARHPVGGAAMTGAAPSQPRKGKRGSARPRLSCSRWPSEGDRLPPRPRSEDPRRDDAGFDSSRLLGLEPGDRQTARQPFLLHDRLPWQSDRRSQAEGDPRR